MEMKVWAEETLHKLDKKLSVTAPQIGARFPHACNDNDYDKGRGVQWWTNGFWPGILWLMYKETGKSMYKDIAVEIENKLDEAIHSFMDLSHDVGFVWSLSSVAQYKLCSTERSMTRALHVAGTLAGRFNPVGRFIRAWNREHNAGISIIDTMMNLALLYWAGEQLKDPRFAHIAKAHADTVIKEFIRPDGSVHHIVKFDADTGERIEAQGGQGYSPESAWSRGQAWAIYGMVLSYHYTKEQRYLDAAKRVAHYFISNLNDDFIPNWDFRAPITEDMALDTSAASCAASGMLTMVKYLPEYERDLYKNAAYHITKSLHENYSNYDNSKQCLLNKATSNRVREKNVNAGLIYGDFFFLESVMKLKDENLELFW